MRTGYLCLILVALIALVGFGCNDDNDNEDLYLGSDTFFQRVYLGNVPVQEGGTFNIPLAYTTTLRFELSREVTSYSLAQLFSFEIWVTNIDTGQALRITTANLLENGDLYWPDTTNRIVEYRLTHPMSYILVGGDQYSFGAPGNTFKVDVIYLVGLAKDGTQFALTDDQFYVVWTDSTQTL